MARNDGDDDMDDQSHLNIPQISVGQQSPLMDSAEILAQSSKLTQSAFCSKDDNSIDFQSSMWEPDTKGSDNGHLMANGRNSVGDLESCSVCISSDNEDLETFELEKSRILH